MYDRMNVTFEFRVEYPEVYETPNLFEIVVFLCMAVIGFLGNILTSFIIIKNKEMRTAINFYLFSLSISNSILLVILFPLNFQYLGSLETKLKCQIRFVMQFR